MCYFGCLVCQKRTHLLFNDVSMGLFDERKKCLSLVCHWGCLISQTKIKITGFVSYVIMVFDKTKVKNKQKSVCFFLLCAIRVFWLAWSKLKTIMSGFVRCLIEDVWLAKGKTKTYMLLYTCLIGQKKTPVFHDLSLGLIVETRLKNVPAFV